MAQKTLDGVGDRKKQWEEWTGTALHIRRRLNGKEVKITGDAIDFRGTNEGRARAVRMGEHLRRIPASLLVEELGNDFTPFVDVQIPT